MLSVVLKKSFRFQASFSVPIAEKKACMQGFTPHFVLTAGPWLIYQENPVHSASST